MQNTVMVMAPTVNDSYSQRMHNKLTKRTSQNVAKIISRYFRKEMFD